MSRQDAIANATKYFDSGAFRAELARRVAMPTESQGGGNLDVLRAYLADEIVPAVEKLGFAARIYDNPAAGRGPFLIAERHEGDALPTVLTYGHGDVVFGHAEQWRKGLDPWQVIDEGDRWYGRGTADNKGQQLVHIAAIKHILATRGSLGFNHKFLVEMGEENGSKGLKEIVEANKADFAADAFFASDGPRTEIGKPNITLGNRGCCNFTLSVNLREGGHHSGNWGGLLANPAMLLAHAVATIVTRTGAIRVPALKPRAIPPAVGRALADLPLTAAPKEPAIDPDWGEPGLSPAEKVFGWSSFEVLAWTAGNPENPVNAIPPRASALR